MTRIIKRYWVWEEKFNSTKFKLGQDIERLVLENKVVPNDKDSSEFFGINDYPWKIRVNDNGKIESVFFRENFFDFLNNEIWDFEFESFVKKVDEILKPETLSDDNSTDRLYVVFRGGFVSIAGIERTVSKDL